MCAGVARTLRACDCADERIVQFAFQIHDRLARESYRLFDDAPAVLAALRQAHIPLGLVTNGAPDAQRDKLRVLGIENMFAVIVVSGEVGVAKPDPRPTHQISSLAELLESAQRWLKHVPSLIARVAEEWHIEPMEQLFHTFVFHRVIGNDRRWQARCSQTLRAPWGRARGSRRASALEMEKQC